MLAIQGIYDGASIIALEPLPPEQQKCKVIITFLNETIAVEAQEMEELRDFTEQSDAFEFWHDEREDLYQDFLPLLAAKKSNGASA
jgi:hypothetical protein